MTVTTTLMSLEDFFAYDDGTDARYELENGELIVMPAESELNRRIATFLFAYFLQAGLLPQYLTMKTEIAVSGARATVRLPDLIVLSEELAVALEGAARSTIMLDMPPPRLVVEVVSPGKQNIDRDYRYKRSQYEARGIAEYWIVDPIAQTVTVLTLVEGLYEAATFAEQAEICSSLLAELTPGNALTADLVLNAGRLVG
jgi:Uma2 family endonuclease